MKYELVAIEKDQLYRIRALRDIVTHGVVAGNYGGLIHGQHNLDQFGEAWVGFGAVVDKQARVSGNALVSDSARVTDYARIEGLARVTGYARVSGKAIVRGLALVDGSARLRDNAVVEARAHVGGNVSVTDNGKVAGQAHLVGNKIVAGDTFISGSLAADYTVRPFDIDVTRVGVGFATITVEATSQAEAEDLALEEAGNHSYSEKLSRYELTNGSSADRESTPIETPSSSATSTISEMEAALRAAHAALLDVPMVGDEYDNDHSRRHTAAALLIEEALLAAGRPVTNALIAPTDESPAAKESRDVVAVDESSKTPGVARSVIEVTVLREFGSEVTPITEFSLEEIARQMDQGEFLGSMRLKSNEVVPPDQVPAAERALGGDGTFFDYIAERLDEEGGEDRGLAPRN